MYSVSVLILLIKDRCYQAIHKQQAKHHTAANLTISPNTNTHFQKTLTVAPLCAPLPPETHYLWPSLLPGCWCCGEHCHLRSCTVNVDALVFPIRPVRC